MTTQRNEIKRQGEDVAEVAINAPRHSHFGLPTMFHGSFVRRLMPVKRYPPFGISGGLA